MRSSSAINSSSHVGDIISDIVEVGRRRGIYVDDLRSKKEGWIRRESDGEADSKLAGWHEKSINTVIVAKSFNVLNLIM
jgi:hypothetical protein